MSDLDNEELIATRRLNGLEDNLFKKSDKNVVNMTEEAFNELIDNFEVVEHLTLYGRKGIKENVKKLQRRIKELEEKKDNWHGCFIVAMENSIPKQKVKDKLEELKKEYTKELEKNSTKAFILKCQITIVEEIWEDK